MSKKVLKHHRNLAALIAELECVPSKENVIPIEELDYQNTAVIQLKDVVGDNSRVNVANVYIQYNQIDDLPEHVTVKSEYSDTFLGVEYIANIEREVKQLIMDYYVKCIDKKGILQ